jgi:hypothetical protein
MQNPGGVIHGIFSFNDLINRSFNNGFSPEKPSQAKIFRLNLQATPPNR